MKIRTYAMMLAASIIMLLCVNQAWAGNLSAPRGLTLDSKGNLYIANETGNNVLVYSPSYVKTNTITAGLNEPSAVALDSQNNIYVANVGSNSITQYSSAGVQNTAFSITNGISNPWAIAIDPLGDLWVTNPGVNYFAAYPLSDPGNVNQPVFTLSPGGPVFGIAAHGGYLNVGGTNYIYFCVTSELLVGRGAAGLGGLPEALALAFDAAGNFYESDAAGVVSGPNGTIVTESFGVAGLAVDSARGRVYVSNQNGNQVLVYSLKGVLLHTIQ